MRENIKFESGITDQQNIYLELFEILNGFNKHCLIRVNKWHVRQNSGNSLNIIKQIQSA